MIMETTKMCLSTSNLLPGLCIWLLLYLENSLSSALASPGIPMLIILTFFCSITVTVVVTDTVTVMCCEVDSDLWQPFPAFPKYRILRHGLPFPSSGGA